MITDALWLTSANLARVFDAIAIEGDDARVVGGAVRNTLMGEPVCDIDVATTAVPDTVMTRARKAGLKPIPTGIDHGTITVVSEGTAYEVTTLREDVETFGRHAVVRFSRDWQADAARRDFTMNALYVDADGAIHDPTGEGVSDCLARRVRFIGDPHARIREDYLRILRFFRFHACYGSGAIDAAGLSAVISAREGLRQLSAERVGHEIRRILPAPHAVETVEAMAETGIIEIVFAGVALLEDFAHLHHLTDFAAEAGDAILRLCALSCFVQEDVERLADRLRLSTREEKRMAHAFGASRGFSSDLRERDVRECLYRVGHETAIDAALLAWCRDEAGPEDQGWRRLIVALRTFEIPVFPVAGRDLLVLGRKPGPGIGKALRALEARWIASDFALTRDDLLAGLEASE
ncbi:CCA tRNA nucleotidyltransferase [Breoghania sp.]|uniref:CCA tRNA nucleotidyltransferase n=1 Tax=Breoghania sp. TaxID=2065378 RepID=UPI0026161E2F|nr:CCA tRNA nucleotidyltransferase [Breoghania sp.]MDJ0931584.1 CCA tRNA nucleotidyltransferase [Breoghania sp.]